MEALIKKKLATIWLAGCSGCHMSLLDLDERLLDLARSIEIVKSPLVDAKEFPECDIALVEGAVGMDPHVEELRVIRKRSAILVALGDCAVTANVPGLRNAFSVQAALRRSYVEAESNVRGAVPDAPEIARILERVRPLHEIVKVDVFVPGCPPSAEVIYFVLTELLHGRIPEVPPALLKYG